MESGDTREAEGDVQVLALGRRGHQGRVLRVVNTYSQRRSREGDYRPAERAEWDDILAEETTIVAGDFNAHSRMWNPHCTARRDATFLEELIRSFDLQDLNDGKTTRQARREGDTPNSVIDLTLAGAGAGPDGREWRVLDEEEDATGSDHELIEGRWMGLTMRVDPS